MAAKVYTFEEVQKHNKQADCWLIISGKVYDVTPFIDEHPGGDELMLTSTGKDATMDFEDVGHSNDAHEKMKELYIGEIDTATIPENTQNVPPPKPIGSSTANHSGDSSSKVLLYLLPLLMLGIAFLLRLYSAKEEKAD